MFHNHTKPGTRLAASAALLTALCARSSFAQLTAAEARPAPNVLLLVDSSGSMEAKANGDLPTCNAGQPALTNEKSRWIDLTEVLTGTFDGYSCWAQDRSSAAFATEFTLGTDLPYDFGYINPYHRALSNSCVVGPGVPPPSATPYAWPDRAVNTFSFAGGAVTRPGALSAHAGCGGFRQASDGLLDIYANQVRFGLMTFDTRVGAGTGLAANVVDNASGITGTWSYFLNSPAMGHPANCTADVVQEVGARNAAAPPWEGRMVAFGPPTEADNTLRNSWIQQVLLSTRPYGATPIAGLLQDARDFLWNDGSLDPLNAGNDFGPKNDPSWRAANCRETIAVLLTDGEPNLDLRPFCEGNPVGGIAGHCPYDRPEDIVASLRQDAPDPNQAVETYVIGFALGSVTPAGEAQPVSCGDVTDAHCADPRNQDGSPEARRVQACCTLGTIAAAGGVDDDGVPRKAYFAENREQLRSIFTQILDRVVRISTRTVPVLSSSGGDSTSSGFKFFSAFNPEPRRSQASLWEGVLERRRFVCNRDLVPVETYEPTKGDDFAANMSSGQGPARRFYSVITGTDLRDSIRPGVNSDRDGLGLTSATNVGPVEANAFAAQIPSSAMQVNTADCANSTSADDCRSLILEHVLGLTNRLGLSRCPPRGACNLLGGIYHSTPQVVPGRPSELLRDESYSEFVASMARVARPSVLYTSTVDGFLHAFNVSPFPGSEGANDRLIASKANNELWAFLPPAVLPVMKAQYPATPAVMLDAPPVIKDVVAREDGAQVRFERRATDAQTGAGLWRTVLVQGFGQGQVHGGYFALDITNPEPARGGPRLLWQITRDHAGNELFGANGTPLITTLYIGDDPTEVAVAVLPGGTAEPSGATTAAIGSVMLTDPPGFETTRPVHSYPGADAARSLTIVRLDTGEVLRTFRTHDGASLFRSSVVTETVIPSPLVGQPQAYPATAGAVADRLFVGDRDGRIWRLDVSSTNPANWTMRVFFDAFWDKTTADLGQPIELPPVLSVDDDGNVTVAFATGDQRAAAAPATLFNRVLSLTERLNENNGFVAHLNWRQELDGGERVTGPMMLFNRSLYYSASRPPTTSNTACDGGASRLFGAHYIQDRATAAAATADPLSGPAAAPGSSDLVLARRSDGMIFGVSLEARPTCSSSLEQVNTDASFGYRQVRQSQQVNPGGFFLSYQVTGSGSDSRGVLEVQQQLAAPDVPATFESWALIYE
jgi:type IV pilus assembly protein PilY1